MKTLFLLRHAKSSSHDRSIRDFDRPLNERGLKAASEIGLLLKHEIPGPELVLTSPALRAQQTTEIVLSESRLASPLKFDERIYEGRVTDLVAVINDVRAEIRTLLLVGHNPGMESLLVYLTGERREMGTAALAKIRFSKAGWMPLRPGEAQLEWLVRAGESKQ